MEGEGEQSRNGATADLCVHPIGIFHSDATYPYDVPRQGVLATGNLGRIILEPGHNFEQALENLEGFSHIWILFWFHRNEGWKPKIQPPRHRNRKVGVFASRSPYRPNPLGMSVVKLVEVRGREILVGDHDLLDGTPILDIKPYLPYADAFPQASQGWTAEAAGERFQVQLSERAEEQLCWLEERGVSCLRGFITDHLSLDPTNGHLHRLVQWHGGEALAYRTWRACFSLQEQTVTVDGIHSGYTEEQLDDGTDRYGDKPLHRSFLAQWRC